MFTSAILRGFLSYQTGYSGGDKAKKILNSKLRSQSAKIKKEIKTK